MGPVNQRSGRGERAGAESRNCGVNEKGPEVLAEGEGEGKGGLPGGAEGVDWGVLEEKECFRGAVAGLLGIEAALHLGLLPFPGPRVRYLRMVRKSN